MTADELRALRQEWKTATFHLHYGPNWASAPTFDEWFAAQGITR